MLNFLLVPIGTRTGLTSIALGLIRALQQNGRRPAYYKPVVHTVYRTDEQEAATHFANQLFHLNPPSPLPLNLVENMIGSGNEDDLIELIVANFNRAAAIEHDVMVVEGVVPDSERSYLADKNVHIARAINARVILIADAQDADVIQLAEQINLSWQEYDGSQTEAAGFILNKFPIKEDVGSFIAVLQGALKKLGRDLPCLGVIPFSAEKSAIRVLDVKNQLNAHVLRGEEALPINRVREIVVAGSSAVQMHHRFTPGSLIIAPGDREDVMMAAALKSLSGVPLAGMVLTCNSLPSPALQNIIEPALKAGVPLLVTELDTYQTAYALSHQPAHVPSDDVERMEGMVNHIAEYINMEAICSDLDKPLRLLLSPPAFRYRMMEQARRAAKRIVLPEGDEPRTIEAAVICQEKGIAQCILLANPNAVQEVATARGITLPSSLEIIDPEGIRGQYIDSLTQMRQHKGMTHDKAQNELEDNVVLGTMMLALGHVDGLVSGAIHTTANTIRPALQLIKTAPQSSLVSSIFFMLMPEQVLVYGDCAVNPDPTAEQLADIAIQSADSAKAFGIEPKVAMISYSTGSSGSGVDVEKVKQATALAKERRPDLLIDGPLQYDAASVPSVGQQKAPNSPVAGQATVFVFPDLNTGNTTYKAVQRSAGVLSVGPMLQGLNKPVNDLSRGALVDDIVYTIAITAIQAEQMSSH